MHIFLIHDDEKRYFDSLVLLEKDKKISIITLYVHPMKMMVKGILRKKIKWFIKGIKTFIFLIKSFFMKDKTIIIGIAPFDITIILWKHLIKKNKIIYHTSWPYWDEKKVPQKLTIFKKFFLKCWMDFITHENTYIVCIMEKIKTELQEKYQKEEEKIFIIPHSVNPVYFQKLEQKRKESFGILFIGRLVLEKGLEDLKKIILHFKDEKKIHFGIIGDGKDKDVIEEVFTLSHVKYYGYIENKEKIREIMKDYDALLLPSFQIDGWEELFGIVILESMAAGIVPIATDCIGPKNIIKDRINGILVRQRDIEKMIESINELRNNKELYSKIRETCLKEAKKYSSDNIKGKWQSLLKEINCF